MAVFHAFYIVQMVLNCAKYHKQTVTAKKAEIKKQRQNKKKGERRVWGGGFGNIFKKR